MDGSEKMQRCLRMTEHQIKAEQACPATHPLEGVGQLRNDFQGHSFPYKYTKYKCDEVHLYSNTYVQTFGGIL